MNENDGTARLQAEVKMEADQPSKNPAKQNRVLRNSSSNCNPNSSSDGWPYIFMPTSLIPYGQLMRLGKPVGILNIYFPYAYGTFYASLISPYPPSLTQLYQLNIFLFLAGFLLRSLGCAFNDIIDRDLDRQVARTRLRPMARGAISPAAAYLFTSALYILWLGILYAIDPSCVLYALPLTFMVAFYPFAKRVTNFPQVVLGITLSWGVFIGVFATGVDPLVLMLYGDTDGAGLVVLFLVYALWTVMHDIIYALQDLKDDKKAGILSMAVSFEARMGVLLWCLALLQLGLLFLLGWIVDAGLVYFGFAVVGNMALFVVMIRRVDLRDPKACLWWFQAGCLIFGTTTFAGLAWESFAKALDL